MENKDNETFQFTYSAKEQEEIKNIRKKYAAPVEMEDKMEQLRKLDQGVTSKATTAALIVGIIGTLILGCGMSLAMTDLGSALGFTAPFGMILGVIFGIVGIVLVSCAYPIYNRTIRKEREKIAPEILRLTDELMK